MVVGLSLDSAHQFDRTYTLDMVSRDEIDLDVIFSDDDNDVIFSKFSFLASPSLRGGLIMS